MISLATELVMLHLRDHRQQYAATMHVGSSDPSLLAMLHCTSDTGALVLVLFDFADTSPMLAVKSFMHDRHPFGVEITS